MRNSEFVKARWINMLVMTLSSLSFSFCCIFDFSYRIAPHSFDPWTVNLTIQRLVVAFSLLFAFLGAIRIAVPPNKLSFSFFHICVGITALVLINVDQQNYSGDIRPVQSYYPVTRWKLTWYTALASFLLSVFAMFVGFISRRCSNRNKSESTIPLLAKVDGINVTITIREPKRRKGKCYYCTIVFSVLLLIICLLVVSLTTSLAVLSMLKEPATSCYGAQKIGRPNIGSFIPDAIYEIPNSYFSVKWNSLKMSLQVVDSTGATYWSTIPGVAFLGIGKGTFTSTVHDNMFKITDNPNDFSIRQTVDSITQVFDGSVVVKGVIQLNQNESQGIQYDMTFQSPPQNLPGHLKFTVNADINSTVENPVRIYMLYSSYKNESFYGFGEQYSFWNLKGTCVPIFTSEQGVGRGLQPLTFLLNYLMEGSGGSWQTTYTSVPHYITSYYNSLFIESQGFAVFDLTSDDMVRLEHISSKPTIVGRILYGTSMPDLVEQYTLYSGRMRPLPKWTGNGLIFGVQGGTETVKSKVAKLMNSNVPLAGVWMQDWSGRRVTSFGHQLWWNWEVDTDWYNDWDALVNFFGSNNISTLTYINPYLVDVQAANKPKYRRNLFREAQNISCLVRDVNNKTLIQTVASPDMKFGTVDLTNPECVAWYSNIIQTNLMGIGRKFPVLGWMADFGENIPLDAQLYGGSGLDIHNKFPELWAATSRRAASESGHDQDAVFFTRSGSTKSPQSSTLQWLGDQLVTWDKYDGLASTLGGMLSSGLSGFSMTHSDIGGYTMVKKYGVIKYLRSKELLMRWMELSAFSDAVFRSHEGNLPDDSWQVTNDQETIDQLAKFANVHSALWPFRNQLMQDMTNYGYPIARPMFFHYGNDKNTWSLNEQFMLGQELIVCPVLKQGQYSVKCYLPAGGDQWETIWGNQNVNTYQNEGRWQDCPAPLGKPCVWYKPYSATAQQILKALANRNVL